MTSAHPPAPEPQRTGAGSVFVPLDSLRVRGDHIASGLSGQQGQDGPAATGPVVTTVREADIDALAAVATVLGRWLREAPEAEPLAAATNPDMLEQWPLAATGHTRTGLRLLARWRDDAEADLHHAADEVAEDLMRLTRGPGRAVASPYESVHRSEEQLLFGEHTLAVRDWYRRFEISVPNQGKEPDDHIGLELEFLATLLVWSLEALDEGEDEQSGAFVAAAATFAAEHPMTWAPGWFESVIDGAQTDFYRAVGHLGLGLTDALAQVLPSVSLDEPSESRR